MADSIVQGLFGASPYDVEQTQNARMFQSADRYAQQAPFERAAGQMYRAGGMLGGAAAQGAGMVNPQVEEARQVQQIMAQIDPNTTEGLTKGALLANKMGNSKLAFLLSKAAQERKAQESDMRLKEAHAKYYETGGSKGRAKEGDPVQLAKDITRARAAAEKSVFDRNGTVQEAADAADVAGAKARIEWENAGAATRSPVPQADETGRIPLSENLGMRIEGGVTPEMKRTMIADALASGDIDAVRSLSTVPATRMEGTVGTKAQAAGAIQRAKTIEEKDPAILASAKFAEEGGKGSAEQITKQQDMAKTAEAALVKINALEKQLQSGDVTTGIAADFRVATNKMLALLGGRDGARKATDSEIANVMMGADVFPLIQSLGIGARGMDTPAEREFMRSVLTGSLALEKDTLKKMTQFRKEAMQREIEQWNSRVDKGELDSYFTLPGKSRVKYGSQPSGGVRKYNPATGRIE